MFEYEIPAGSIICADHHDDLYWSRPLPCDCIQAGHQALGSAVCRHHDRYAHWDIVAASVRTNLRDSTSLCPAVESIGGAVGQMMLLAQASHATLSSPNQVKRFLQRLSTRESCASMVSMRENDPG